MSKSTIVNKRVFRCWSIILASTLFYISSTSADTVDSGDQWDEVTWETFTNQSGPHVSVRN